jgi:phage protein D
MNPIRSFPDLRIELGGTALAASDAAALAQVRVRQRLSLPSQCELVFHEPKTLDDVRSGASLRLQISGRDPALFEGEVTAVDTIYEPSGGCSVRIRAYDALHRLRKRQPVRLHVQMTAADLARELVADLGVSVEAEESGPLHERIFQVGLSDLDLLDRTARRAGLYFALQDGACRLFTLSGVDERRSLKRGDTLLEARLEVNGDPACRSVRPRAGIPRGRKCGAASPRGRARGAASRARSRPPTSAGAASGRGSTSPSETIARRTRSRRRSWTSPSPAEVTLWGVAEGDPALRPGCRVELEGVAPSFQGTYVLSSVEHRLDPEQGFVSEIGTLPPPPREEPSATVVALGQVTQVDDPRSWAASARRSRRTGISRRAGSKSSSRAPGSPRARRASRDRRPRAAPLSEGDPAQAVVAGGLYGSDGPPTAASRAARRGATRSRRPGPESAARRRREEAAPRGPDGELHRAQPGPRHVHAQVDLTLEAPGRALRIRGRSIDFEQA